MKELIIDWRRRYGGKIMDMSRQINIAQYERDSSVEKARKLIQNNKWVPVELCRPQTSTGSPVRGGIKFLVTVQSLGDPDVRHVRLAYYYPAGLQKYDSERTCYEKDEWRACDYGDLINNDDYNVSAWKPAPEPYQ